MRMKSVRLAFVPAVVVFALLSLLVRSAHAQTAPAKNDTMYEVFVRSFASSGTNKVGDLNGLRAKLDYLNDGDPKTDNDLNVGIIWLMPIFPSRSYHGYDVVDYRNVNPEYGTLDDLKALTDAAHQRGMRVILDIPFNHSSRENAWFKEAIENPNSPKRNWYFIKPDDGTPTDGWRTTKDSHGNALKYFGLFSGSMPDLNFDNAEVRDEVKQIAKFWLDRGIDGFRLDAAQHLYGWNFKPTDEEIGKNNVYWREFSDFCRTVNPNVLLMGEVLGNEHVVSLHARGLDSLVDSPFMHAARKQIESPEAGFVAQHVKLLKSANAENPTHTFEPFVFIASHDENPRLMSELENKVPPGEVDARYRLGMCILMSMSARPLLYEGDELMQRGWAWKGNSPNDRNPGDGSGVYDETLREPIPWYAGNSGAGQTLWQSGRQANFLPHYDKPNDGISVEEENADQNSVLNLVRALSTLRKNHPTYASGAIGAILNDTAEWSVFERGTGDGERYLVMINLTNKPVGYIFKDDWHPEYRSASVVFWSDGAGKEWKDQTAQPKPINGGVMVPAFGMTVLKK